MKSADLTLDDFSMEQGGSSVLSRLWLVATIILVLGSTACSVSKTQSDVTQVPSVISPTTVQSATVVATTTSIPQPRSDKGTVTGILIRTKAGIQSGPMVGATLYLAPLIHSADKSSSLAKHRKDVDPFAATDQEGRFVFSNVEPDTYALVYSSGATEFLVQESESKDLLINVVVGKVIDLHEIRIELP